MRAHALFLLYPLVHGMPLVLTADSLAGSTSRHSETAPFSGSRQRRSHYRLQI